MTSLLRIGISSDGSPVIFDRNRLVHLANHHGAGDNAVAAPEGLGMAQAMGRKSEGRVLADSAHSPMDNQLHRRLPKRMEYPILILLAVTLVVTAASCAIILRQAHALQALRLLAEQTQAGLRAENETTRNALRTTETSGAERLAGLRGALDVSAEQIRTTLSRDQGELRLALAEGQAKTIEQTGAQFETVRQLLELKLRELREGNEAKLAEIHKTVNEQLHAAVEKQMGESFNRVIDQFTAVQKAMGDVQAVTAQIGDIKRLFSNVKTRGGWGETQVKAMLDDILPPGAYETNKKVRPDSDDVVEFAVIMPMRGENRPLLPIDSKFPIEDYDRLLAASEAGDIEAERAATRMLERRVRDEARKIATKYIAPPMTVEFAILYLPTDALYAEVARIPWPR